MEKSIIKVRDLSCAYGDNLVLMDVDVDFQKGKKTAIIGPNGAGKSTLIKGMLGLINKVEGTIYYDDKDIKKNMDKIVYVPQSDEVNWDFPISVIEVVMMGSKKIKSIFNRFTNEDREDALLALKKVHMEEYKDNHISELSGGQRRRVFIARCLNQKGEVYILDEPFSGIDLETEKVIIKILDKLKNEGKTIIAVHHDLNTLREYFDNVVVINKTIKESGDIKSLFNKGYENFNLGGKKDGYN